MPFYRTPDGMMMHINFGAAGNKKAPPTCRARRQDGSRCGWMAPTLCDWKVPEGGRCDRPICEVHALEVGPDRHLCPDHAEQYRLWLQELCIAY